MHWHDIYCEHFRNWSLLRNVNYLTQKCCWFQIFIHPFIRFIKYIKKKIMYGNDWIKYAGFGIQNIQNDHCDVCVWVDSFSYWPPCLYIILGILYVITFYCLFQSIIYDYIPLVSLYIFYNIAVVNLEDVLYESHPVRLCFLAICCSQQNINMYLCWFHLYGPAMQHKHINNYENHHE